VLNTASSLLVYFLAATLLAEVIILAYVWFAWKLDRERLVGMLAVAQGIDLATPAKAGTAQEEIAQEQASYKEIVESRATKFRDLELREQALQNALDQLKADQRRVAEQEAEYRQISQEFTAQLATLAEGAKAEGRDEVRRILEALRPAQAKLQLMEMLEADEIDEVVVLLTGMQDAKRAKILAEFKNEENKEVAEVLRLIREGEPKAGTAQDAIGQLGTNAPVSR
jgi:hypothetical protein